MRVHYEEKETMVHVPWDDRSFTASVILSVFISEGEAQLNTENAGKIISSWADENISHV